MQVAVGVCSSLARTPRNEQDQRCTCASPLPGCTTYYAALRLSRRCKEWKLRPLRPGMTSGNVQSSVGNARDLDDTTNLSLKLTEKQDEN